MGAENEILGPNFFLPEGVEGKLNFIEVGPFIKNPKQINSFFGVDIHYLTQTKLYLLHTKNNVDEELLKMLEDGAPFVDRIIHVGKVNSPIMYKNGIWFRHVIQSNLNPGTSDMEGTIALEEALYKMGLPRSEGLNGFLFQNHFIQGWVGDKLEDIANYLSNPELNQNRIFSNPDYWERAHIQAPVVTLDKNVQVEKLDVANMSHEDLLAMNKERKLAASLEELLIFQNIYRDDKFLVKREELGIGKLATDVEIEGYFGVRSEHCFHKEFNAKITIENNHPILARAAEKGWLKKEGNGYVLEDGIFKKFIVEPARNIESMLEKRGNNWIASMFDDNSGVVYYDKDFMFAIKEETHNSPSNKEPVQGAKTGIDGVNRDIFGTMRGSFDAIANFFYYLTGNPDYQGWLPNGVKHPNVLLRGITQGVREGGNESQIPTLGGGLITDPRFIAKILVYCGTVGWSPVEIDGIDLRGKHEKVGDYVYVAGQAVGVDGIHGATESSLSATANISLGHVQADFSFIQAKVKQYILELGRKGQFTGVTDFGAMGLGSAAFETARSTNGMKLHVDKHPTKYEGIWPWQVIASETQDRMLLVADPSTDVLSRAEAHGVEVSQVGELTDSGFIEIYHKNELVGLFDIEKLFNKDPRKEMTAKVVTNEDSGNNFDFEVLDYLPKVLSRPDVAGKHWFFKQKDFVVKGATVQGPLLGERLEVDADATIQRPLDLEGHDNGGIAYAMGIRPKLSDFNAFDAAQISYTDMIGQIVAIGGKMPNMEEAKWDAWAVCGNYCQPNSEYRTTLIPENGKENLGSLVLEAIGIREAIEATNIPVISGKDSMKCSCIYDVDENFDLENVPADLRKHITLLEEEGRRRIEIHDPDTYLASAAVRIKDISKIVTPGFKEAGELIYLIGETKNHLGGTALEEAVRYETGEHNKSLGSHPTVDMDAFIENSRLVEGLIENRLITSSTYLRQGGLAVAIAKGAMVNDMGAEVYDDSRTMLFSETPGRYMVTVPTNQIYQFLNFIDTNGGNVSVGKVGMTHSRWKEVSFGDKIELTQNLREAYLGGVNLG